MRGYGLPRNDDVAHPDVADIRQYGLSAGHLPGKGGVIRSMFKKVWVKARARRRWKKAERRRAKQEIRRESEE